MGEAGPEGTEGRRPRRARLAYAGGSRHQAAVHACGRRGAGLHRQHPRRLSLRARAEGDDVRRTAVDDPAVRGLLDGGRVERVLPAWARRRAEGAQRRLRSCDAPRLRQRPPARARGRGQGRRGHRLRRGHEDPVRRHPARRDERQHDDERRRASGAGELHRGRGRAGREAGGSDRDHPERHPQGVHGPQHVHLPAGAVDAHRQRHHRAHQPAHAALQLDLDQRLPHAGGRRDGGPGAGVHHRRRPRVRARGARQGSRHRRLRAAALVLLRHRHELLHGSREAARGAPAYGPR